MRRRSVAADQTGNVVVVSDDMPVDEPIDELIEDELIEDELIDDEPAPDEPPDEALDPAVPGSLRWELPGPTGVPAVDDAVAPLAELGDLPTGEHVAYYETVHRRLQDALADLDSA